jgi:hypothetical protein
MSRSARSLLNEQRDLMVRLERGWQRRIDTNAQRAGETQVLGIAIAIPLTVAFCVDAFMPHGDPQIDKPNGSRSVVSKPIVGLPGAIGLTAAQTREVVSKLSLCQTPTTNGWHPCIDVENQPRIGL